MNKYPPTKTITVNKGEAYLRMRFYAQHEHDWARIKVMPYGENGTVTFWLCKVCNNMSITKEVE